MDFNYIAGLTAADGSFSTYKPSIITNWANFDAAFRLAQDKGDRSLLCRVMLSLSCGNVSLDKQGMCSFAVRKK